MKNFYAFILFFMSMTGFSQTKQDYIYNYAKFAVSEMETARIPASITLAQGILESRYGTSELSEKSNNHFGIKCHKGWEGKSVKYDDDAKDECFRQYLTAAESYRDHSLFLSTRDRYSDLFKLSIYDYKGWAKGLRKAGYATNPKYADHLIRIIEEEQLYVFDRMTSQEVDPYIASLRNKVHTNEVFVVRVDDQPTPKATTKPIETTSIEPTPVKVITVQGGPRASPENDIAQTRDIFIENDIKTVFSYSGDSPSTISSMYDIPLDRLYKYNEWPEYLNEFTWGMKVYLQPKRTKSRDITALYHKVAPGETMYQIAQHYGIKTDKLYQRNLMSIEHKEQPRVGEMVSLRKKSNIKPLLRRANERFTVEQMTQQKQDEAVNPVIEESEVLLKPQIQTSLPVAEKKASPPQPVTESTPLSEENTSLNNPWSTYPSTKVSDSKEKQQLAEENGSQQAGGRSIIYDATPPINQQPVRGYEPPQVVRNGNTSAPTPAPTPPVSEEIIYHTVEKGDTLYGLAKKYSVSVPQIKEWNNLTSSTIKLGQKLIVRK